MTELEQLLPALYHTTPQDKELQRVLLNMAVRAAEDKDAAVAQLFPSTADSLGLELWERAYGIPIQTGQSLQQRRARILSKVCGQRVTTVELIRSVVKDFVNGEVVVTEEYSKYCFVLNVTLLSGTYPDYDLISNAVNLIKPSHLDYQIILHFFPSVSVYTSLPTRIGDVWIVGPMECSGHTGSEVYTGIAQRRSDMVRMAAISCPQPLNPVTVSMAARRSDIVISKLEE